MSTGRGKIALQSRLSLRERASASNVMRDKINRRPSALFRGAKGDIPPQRAAAAMKPLIFISSVSRELRTARQLVANTLHALGYEPVWQDIFETSPDDLREMLRKKIDRCSAVLQIVGHAYGAEPPTPDATFGRCSYTQYEALYARSRKKPVYYLIAENDLPRDAAAETIDTPVERTPTSVPPGPRGPGYDETAAALADAAERQRLQSVYRNSVLTSEQVWYPIHTPQETELAVRRLRDDLSKLRRGFRYSIIGIMAALLLIAGGVGWLNRGMAKQDQKLDHQGDFLIESQQAQHTLLATVDTVAEAQKKAAAQAAADAKKADKADKAAKITADYLAAFAPNQDSLKDVMLKEIEKTYQKDLQEADKLPEWPKRVEAKRDAAAARDLKLRSVDEDVTRITSPIKSGNASIELLEWARIFQEQGGDQALTYTTSQESPLLERAGKLAAENQRDIRRKIRRELAPLLEGAKLQFTKGNLAEAIRLSEEVQKHAPEWSENNQNYFWSMIRMVQMELYGGDGKRAISRIEAIETRAQRVRDSYPEDLPSREALALAAGLRGDIYIQAGEFEQAEQRFKECHEALIPLSAEAPDNKSIQRSLAVLSDKLGRVLLNKNDDENAGLLFTQGRDLLTALLQKYPGDTDCLYSLAVSYESLGTLAMKKADYRLAERCFEEQQTILIAFPEQNPLSVFARLSLVASHLNLALVKAPLGEAQEARSMLNSALRVLDALATESPDFQRVQETTFAAKYTTGRVLTIIRDFQGSMDAYRSAHRYLTEHPDLPRNGELLRHCKASSLKMESILLCTKGDILGARDKAVASLTVVEAIIQSNQSTEWILEKQRLNVLIMGYDFGLGNDFVLPGLFK